jgi:hypothetical protein
LITETRVGKEERTQTVQPSLTSLDLTDNKIGKQGVTELAGSATPVRGDTPQRRRWHGRSIMLLAARGALMLLMPMLDDVD